jgi:hypothetical protein
VLIPFIKRTKLSVYLTQYIENSLTAMNGWARVGGRR